MHILYIDNVYILSAISFPIFYQYLCSLKIDLFRGKTNLFWKRKGKKEQRSKRTYILL